MVVASGFQFLIGFLVFVFWVIAQIARARGTRSSDDSRQGGSPIGGPPGIGPTRSPEDELRQFLAGLTPGQDSAPPSKPPPLPQQPRPQARPAQAAAPTSARRPPPARRRPDAAVPRAKPAPARRQPEVRPQAEEPRQPARPAAVAAVDEGQLLRDGLTQALFGPRIGPPRRTTQLGAPRARRPAAALLRGLKSGTGLRRAVLAREILDPPIALRDDLQNRRR